MDCLGLRMNYSIADFPAARRYNLMNLDHLKNCPQEDYKFLGYDLNKRSQIQNDHRQNYQLAAHKGLYWKLAIGTLRKRTFVS